MGRQSVIKITITIILMFFTFPFAVQTVRASSKGTVRATSLNVRSGPDIKYGRIASIKKGQTYDVLETLNGWYKLRIGSRDGWVDGRYLTVASVETPSHGDVSSQTPPSETIKVTASLLNVRSSPTVSSKKIGQIKKGEAYPYFEKSGVWYRIKFGSAYGWVHGDYVAVLQEAAAPSQKPLEPPKETGGSNEGTSAAESVTIKANSLNVRSGPSTSHIRIGSVKKGNTYIILGTSSNWYKIRYNTKEGWICGDYVTINYKAVDNKPANNGSENKNEPQNNNSSNSNNENNGGKQVEQPPNSQVKAKNNYLIVIDAGHGGVDPGAVSKSGQYEEQEFNLDITRRLRDLLKAQGYNTYLTRDEDEYVSLTDRVHKANNLNASAFISVHINSFFFGMVNGIETLYSSSGKASGEELARLIQNNLVEELKRKDRGVKNRPGIMVLNAVNMPSALAEIMFISNNEELELLKKEDTRQRAAEAIGKAVNQYFGFN